MLKITNNFSIVIYENHELIVSRQFWGIGSPDITEINNEGRELGNEKIKRLPLEIRNLFPDLDE